MPIVVAHPKVWTLLGTGPIRVFPKSWRIGLLASLHAPNASDEPEEIVKGDDGLACNSSLPIYAKPLDGILTAIGVSQIVLPGGPSLTPINLVPPSISGTPLVGELLTIDLGTWANSPTNYVVQVCRNASQINVLTANVSSDHPTYTVQVDDLGTVLSVMVTAINNLGSSVPIVSPSVTVS